MDSWLNEYLNKIHKYDYYCRYIYGAGNAGKIILNLCRENNIAVTGFCVTNASDNVKDIDGVKVYQFDKLNYDPDRTVFLVGLLEHGEKRLEKTIRKAGAKNVIALPDELMITFDERDNYRRRTPIIEVTPKIGCSVNCRYCPQSLLLNRYFDKDKKRKSVMSLDDYKGFLNKLPGETIIDFSGFVEPFLNPDALQMMLYTAEKKHTMTLFTTFRGLSYEQFQKLKELPFEYVCLHTPDKDRYADIPMTDEYLRILEEAVTAKKADGRPFIDAANCQSEPHPKVLEITKNKIKIFCELQDRAGNLDKTSKELIHAHLRGPVICTRANNVDHNVLLPDGTLVLCCNDFGLEYEIGNLAEQSYDEIINGKKMKAIREGMKAGSEDFICRKCFSAKKDNRE